MDILSTLGSTLGLGFLAGLRLYATVLAIGVILRFHWFQLPAAWEHLNVFANPWVMGVAAVCCAFEFFADKVPWVDSLWDSIHTVIRPLGAAIIGASAFGSSDPATRTAIALLCGGVALTGHSSKAATRLVANHSPEPFTNVALSVAEDLFVPFGLWMSVKHPVITFCFVAIFVALFAFLAPRIFRLMRIEWLAISSLLKRLFITAPPVPALAWPRVLSDQAIAILQSRLRPFNTGTGNMRSGVLCAAATPGALRNSVGYLYPADDRLEFVTRRLLRRKTHAIPYNAIREAKIHLGLLLDTLELRTDSGIQEFDIFKTAEPRESYKTSVGVQH
jgi:hypothetical protein